MYNPFYGIDALMRQDTARYSTKHEDPKQPRKSLRVQGSQVNAEGGSQAVSLKTREAYYTSQKEKPRFLMTRRIYWSLYQSINYFISV